MPATPHMQIVSVAIIAINVSGHLCARNINENAFSTHSHSPERYIDTIYNQIIYYHSINTKLYANICWFQISLLVHISHGYGDGFFFSVSLIDVNKSRLVFIKFISTFFVSRQFIATFF